MKKLAIFLTFLFILFPAKAFANCENVSRNSLTNGNLNVNFINSDNTTGGVVANLNSSALLPTDTKSITAVSKNIVTSFNGEFLILNGSFEIASFADLTATGHNANFPNLQSLPSPSIILNSDVSKESYCEIISITNGNLPIVYDYNGNSPIYRLASFSYSLKCHRHQDFPSTSTVYRIYFYLDFGNLNGTSIGLDSGYYISNNYRSPSLSIDDSCTIDNLIGEIQALGFDVTEIKDTIQDTNVSGSTSEFEDVLEDWSYDDFSLSDFVTSPFNFIRSLANQNECSPITLPALLGNTSTFILPCIMETFEVKFPSLFTIYQIAIYFFVCYRIGIDLFRTVHKLKDPLNDEISVADI